MNPISGKIAVLYLCVETMLINQILGFFKMLYLKEGINVKCIFGMQINIEVFFKLILSLWVYLARHTQKSQNSKSAISLQNMKESVMDEVDFIRQIILSF